MSDDDPYLSIRIERDLVDTLVDPLAKRLVRHAPAHAGARKALDEALARKDKPGVSRSDVIRVACAMLLADLDSERGEP